MLSPQEVDLLAEKIKDFVTRLILTNTDQALKLADGLVLLAKITQKEEHRALGLRMKGMALVQGKGDCLGALELYWEAVQIHQDNGDLLGEALVYLNEIWALGNLGRYEEAIRKGEWAKRTLEKLGERFILAKLCNNLAWVYQRVGRFHESLLLFDQAVLLFEEAGPEGESFLTSVENNRALSLCYIGRYQEATEAGEKAIKWGEKLKQAVAIARAKHTLGMIFSVQGHFTRALSLYEEAIEAHEAFHQEHEAALCKLSAMGCLWLVRRFSDLLRLHDEIRPLFQRLNMPHETALAAFFKANVLVEIGAYAEAKVVFQEARRIFAKEGNLPFVGRCDLGQARLSLKREAFSEALQVARKCATWFKASNMPIFYVIALLLMAEAKYKMGAHRGSVRLLNKVQKILANNKIDELLYPCYHLLGKIHRERNKLDKAFACFDQAILAIEQLRGNIMLEYRADFVADKQNVYEDMVALCVAGNMPHKGLQYAERAKSRALLEMLSYRPDMSIQARTPQDTALVEELIALREQREAKLQFGTHLLAMNNGEHQQKVVQLQEEVRGLEKAITALWHRLLMRNADYARNTSLWEVTVQETFPLAPQTVLVEYFSIGSQWVAFVLFSENGQQQSDAVRLSVTTHEIENLLQRFKVNLGFVPRSSAKQRENLIANAQNVLQLLYEYLIAPITALLSRESSLIIVPHGLLHYLPFHALYDGEHYLVENFEITYLPAASLLANHQTTVASRQEMLIMGHSLEGRLPYAAEEAQQIAKLWKLTALNERDASLQSFLAQAKDARLIHLACHGEFRADNPLFSGLTLEGGTLTTLDIFNMRLQASLVTLSACLTGRSVIEAGDELFGLMRAFLSAGAASLLLTHWPVADESTAQLMHDFYQNLKRGQTKAKALQTIQRQFLSGEKGQAKDFRHPYYWAPFFLVGKNSLL
ncbi:MAG: CHAT domain-containing protein [Anaerolineales bacterium]